MSSDTLRALFLNEGDSAGTRGQGRFDSIVREQLTAVDEIDPAFACMRPMRGVALRAASGVWGPLWRRDLDLQPARWHLIQALRARAVLGRALAASRPDIVHVHPHTAAFALGDPDRLPPVVLSVDAEVWDWRAMGIWQAVRPWSRAAMTTSLIAQRRCLERAALVLAWTAWSHAGVMRAAPRARAIVQHPGLDLEHFRPAGRVRRRVPRVLFVGARFAKKGGFDLIAALDDELHAGRVELDVVSPDPIPPRPGVRTHRLHGRDPALLGLFQQADCFCLPSYGDSAAWVVLEAMACGTPVVASRTGALPDFLDDGRAGVLVDAGDVPQLRRALADLLGDRDRARELGRIARTRCEARYDARVNTRLLVERMRELAGRSVTTEIGLARNALDPLAEHAGQPVGQAP
jgi:glycosyltransferase involved in cell wall biosynthesis